jgi:glycosyltransferase involved in cell wall biosynthesis
MPHVWKRIPGARVYITGKDAPAEMATWGQDERVILTGFVPDERTVIAKSTIMVLPMRLGGGIKLKLLTAMASGKAMVSTTAGAEGAPSIVDGEHLLLRDESEPFADAIADLIENASLRRKLADNARRYVCEHFDWRVIGLQWDKVLREVCDHTAAYPSDSAGIDI